MNEFETVAERNKKIFDYLRHQPDLGKTIVKLRKRDSVKKQHKRDEDILRRDRLSAHVDAMAIAINYAEEMGICAGRAAEQCGLPYEQARCLADDEYM